MARLTIFPECSGVPVGMTGKTPFLQSEVCLPGMLPERLLDGGIGNPLRSMTGAARHRRVLPRKKVSCLRVIE